MKKQYKPLIAVLAFAALLGGAAFLYSSLQQQYSPQIDLAVAEESERETIPAPDFTVLDSAGNEIKLSDFHGKPIVLNFWASWCPPCKREMPDFQEVYEELGNDVTFVMVDLVSSQETQATGEAYIVEQGYTFPVYYDVNQEAAYAYGISSIPTSFFIDADGNIVTGVRGAIDKNTLLSAIEILTGDN